MGCSLFWVMSQDGIISYLDQHKHKRWIFRKPAGEISKFERGVVDNLFFSYISIDLSMELYELYVYVYVCVCFSS